MILLLIVDFFRPEQRNWCLPWVLFLDLLFTLRFKGKKIILRRAWS